MGAIVYLIRHAESEHNISKDFSQPDPPLTSIGLVQASSLASTFPDAGSVAVVLSSPLKRALQTTLAGFSHIINTGSLNGASKGAVLGSLSTEICRREAIYPATPALTALRWRRRFQTSTLAS